MSGQLKYLDGREDSTSTWRPARLLVVGPDNKVRAGMPLDRITATFMLPYVDHRGGRAEPHGARRLVNKPIRVRQSALFVRDRDTLGVTRYPGTQG